MRTHNRVIVAHHIVITLYGHWPPNDIRGSGSREFYDDKFEALGPIHRGRKPPHKQPARDELRRYHREVEPLLNFPRFWLNDATRQVVADAFGSAIRANRYTCYACAICSNHMHLIIRRHRDSYETMFALLTEEARSRLVASHLIPDVNEHHPVFSNRPYSVFLYTPEDIRGRITYIEQNPLKEGLPLQHFDFVTAYDGWPLAKKQRTT